MALCTCNQHDAYSERAAVAEEAQAANSAKAVL